MPALEVVGGADCALLWEKLGDRNGEPVLAAPRQLRVGWQDKRRQAGQEQASSIYFDAQVEVAFDEVIPVGSLMWQGGLTSEDDASSYWHGAGIDWDAGSTFEVVSADRISGLNGRGWARRLNLQRYRGQLTGGWEVLRIPDLKLWLNADHGLFTTSTGVAEAEDNADPVGRWVSLDQRERTFKQATAANRPTLRLNEINGKQAVRFDGVNDSLSSDADVHMPEGFTVYLAGTLATTMLMQANIDDGQLSVTVGGNVSYTDSNTAVGSASYAGSSGDVILRFRMAGTDTTCKFAATGMAEVTLSGMVDPHLHLGFMAQHAADWRHVLAFGRNLEANERDAVEKFLRSDLGVEIG